MKAQKLNVSDIRTDGGTQPRAAIDENVVNEYAESLEDGVVFPPIVAFFDGVDTWLADGFHRLLAHVRNGVEKIGVELRSGTKDDAILYSLGANSSHGLRRTNADKRKAVLTALEHPKFSQWPDTKIAKACGVSHTFVAACRSPEKAKKQAENKVKASTRQAESKQKAGDLAEKAGKKQSTPAKDHDSKVVIESDSETPQELLIEMQGEIASLTERVKVLSSDDKGAELHKQMLLTDHAKREQENLARKLAESQKRESWANDQLKRCCKALGISDPRKLAAAVEKLASSIAS